MHKSEAVLIAKTDIYIKLGNAINASLVPETYQRLKDKNYDGLANKVDFVLFAFIMKIAFVILMGPDVVWIMG